MLDVIVFPCNGNGGGIRRTVEVIAICSAEFAKEDLHRLGGLEREPRVDAVIRELAGQATKDETAKHTSISRPLRVTLTVRKAPCGEVKRCAIRSKEAITTCESDGVAQNRTAYGVSYMDKMSQVERSGR